MGPMTQYTYMPMLRFCIHDDVNGRVVHTRATVSACSTVSQLLCYFDDCDYDHFEFCWDHELFYPIVNDASTWAELTKAWFGTSIPRIIHVYIHRRHSLYAPQYDDGGGLHGQSITVQ